MLLKQIVPVVALVALVGGCQSAGPKQSVGTVGGAAAGALLGSQFGHGTGQLVAVGLGTLLGAFVGNEIGTSLDATDEMQAQHAARRAYTAPVGEQIIWNNPQTGNRGTITTVNEGYSVSGNYCREFQQTVVIGGRSERAMGRACQQPDGTWKIVP